MGLKENSVAVISKSGIGRNIGAGTAPMQVPLADRIPAADKVLVLIPGFFSSWIPAAAKVPVLITGFFRS